VASPLVFDYSSLPREFPRRYLSTELSFDWENLSKVFNELSARNLTSLAELKNWLLDQAELDAYIYEQRTLRYINSTRQTDNPDYTRPYEHYVEELEPKIKVASFELLKKYAASPFRDNLPREEYGLEDKRRQSAVTIFRPENVDLEKTDSTLAQKYERTIGTMTVNFRGQERTLQQMAKFYEETDRSLREEAWRLADSRSLKDSSPLDDIFSEMVRIRHRIARNAGFDNFHDYIFVKKDRFDYTPSDCLRFHEAVEESFVPLSREIDKERMEKLGLDVLMPWDLRADPEGRPPLSPFEDAAGLILGAAKVVDRIDPEFSTYFARMTSLGLLDLESRKGKAPGGYQEDLSEVKLPFIFMNAAKRDDDVRTLLHECGHSFHAFIMRDKGLPYFNSGQNLPTEFAEVASTSMELISGEHYEGAFYNGQDARRSNKEEAVDIVKLFAWAATIDAFQHWVYTHPDHTREERAEAWIKTFRRFSGLESYEGLGPSLAYRWQRQLHLFEVPFYYIEYGIASTGALGIWAKYRRDRGEAIEAYKNALSLGASRSLPELFGAAGLRWDLGPNALGRLASELRSAIREYS
jgi:oligoendopeptidase F